MYILKKTPIHCAIMSVATETIHLATDLLWSSPGKQYEVANNPTVHITGITWSAPTGNIVITRNSVAVWNLTLSGTWKFNGWSDTAQAGSDIVITIPAGGGTIVLELLKYSGYGNTQMLNDVI